jgi:hypothetical protein
MTNTMDIDSFIKKVHAVKVLGKDEGVKELLDRLAETVVEKGEGWKEMIVKLLSDLRGSASQAQLEKIKTRIIDGDEYLSKELDEMYLGIGGEVPAKEDKDKKGISKGKEKEKEEEKGEDVGDGKEKKESRGEKRARSRSPVHTDGMKGKSGVKKAGIEPIRLFTDERSYADVTKGDEKKVVVHVPMSIKGETNEAKIKQFVDGILAPMAEQYEAWDPSTRSAVFFNRPNVMRTLITALVLGKEAEAQELKYKVVIKSGGWMMVVAPTGHVLLETDLTSFVMRNMGSHAGDTAVVTSLLRSFHVPVSITTESSFDANPFVEKYRGVTLKMDGGYKYLLFYGDGIAFHMVSNGTVWFEQKRYNVSAYSMQGHRLGKLEAAVVKVYRYKFLSDGEKEKGEYRVPMPPVGPISTPNFYSFGSTLGNSEGEEEAKREDEEKNRSGSSGDEKRHKTGGPVVGGTGNKVSTAKLVPDATERINDTTKEYLTQWPRSLIEAACMKELATIIFDRWPAGRGGGCRLTQTEWSGLFVKKFVEDTLKFKSEIGEPKSRGRGGPVAASVAKVETKKKTEIDIENKKEKEVVASTNVKIDEKKPLTPTQIALINKNRQEAIKRLEASAKRNAGGSVVGFKGGKEDNKEDSKKVAFVKANTLLASKHNGDKSIDTNGSSTITEHKIDVSPIKPQELNSSFDEIPDSEFLSLVETCLYDSNSNSGGENSGTKSSKEQSDRSGGEKDWEAGGEEESSSNKSDSEPESRSEEEGEESEGEDKQEREVRELALAIKALGGEQQAALTLAMQRVTGVKGGGEKGKSTNLPVKHMMKRADNKEEGTMSTSPTKASRWKKDMPKKVVATRKSTRTTQGKKKKY